MMVPGLLRATGSAVVVVVLSMHSRPRSLSTEYPGPEYPDSVSFPTGGLWTLAAASEPEHPAS
eukprot:2240760-Rhodomonas_salina.1